MRGDLIVILTCLSTTSQGYVMKGKSVSASSFQNGMGPEKAIDGDTNARYPNLFHSHYESALAWWSVDLGEEVISPKVKIYFRTDYKLRRNGVRISLSNVAESATTFCEVVTGASDGSNIPDVYEVTCDARGRYLTISTVTDNGDGVVLDFGEVELPVSGCPEKTFGPNCDSECHCANGTCDPNSGECFSGCMPGWKSSQCDELITSADVSVSMKYIAQCEVSVTFKLETVDMALLAEMEEIQVDLRIECMHTCDALDLCISFEYRSPKCTLWRPGSSGHSGTRDMWKKQH